MVQKTVALGFGILAAISAPTAAAINLANRLRVTLIGFLRGEQYVVYTHSDYLDQVDHDGTLLLEQRVQTNQRL
jgi:formate dehydrogenase accessory protein FdhD